MSESDRDAEIAALADSLRAAAYADHYIRRDKDLGGFYARTAEGYNQEWIYGAAERPSTLINWKRIKEESK